MAKFGKKCWFFGQKLICFLFAGPIFHQQFSAKSSAFPGKWSNSPKFWYILLILINKWPHFIWYLEFWPFYGPRNVSSGLFLVNLSPPLKEFLNTPCLKGITIYHVPGFFFKLNELCSLVFPINYLSFL